jgi:hypothetical protein
MRLVLAELLLLLQSTESILTLEPIQPPIQWVRGALSQGVKRPGCEPGLSLPSSAEVKTDVVVSPLPHSTSWFHYWHDFTFTFYVTSRSHRRPNLLSCSPPLLIFSYPFRSDQWSRENN